MHRRQFFFSYQLDNEGLHFGAYWGEEVRYHEWIHLAMTLDSDEFRGYVNGKLVGAIAAHGGKDRGCSPTNITNTVLHVMGKKSEQSTPGMVEHLMLHERALRHEEIIDAMKRQPHSRPPYLNSLLESHGRYSLEGLCMLDLRGHGYLQLSWGLCPEVICGQLCIDEAVVIGDALRRHKATHPLPSIPPRISRLRQGRVFRDIPSDAEPAADLPRPITNKSALLNDSLFHGFPRPELSGRELVEYEEIEKLYESAVRLLSGRTPPQAANPNIGGNRILFISTLPLISIER